MLHIWILDKLGKVCKFYTLVKLGQRSTRLKGQGQMGFKYIMVFFLWGADVFSSTIIDLYTSYHNALAGINLEMCK